MTSTNQPEDHHGDHSNSINGIGAMCFRDAWAALQTSVERLQRADLDIEDLSVTYGRAMALADHCASILAQVQQQVTQIDPELLETDPAPATGNHSMVHETAHDDVMDTSGH